MKNRSVHIEKQGFHNCLPLSLQRFGIELPAADDNSFSAIGGKGELKIKAKGTTDAW